MQSLTLLSRKTPKFIAFPAPTQSRSISSLKHGKKFPAGHNAAGRITSFHRGGCHKRLFRQIDFKRSINSTGVVERIEYDPNRSSRIALVRWIQVQNFRRQNELSLPANAHQKLIDASTATAKVSSTFSFSSLPGNILDGRVSPPESLSLDSFPRIAVAGAKPSFFAVEREDLGAGVQKHEFLLKEIKKWDQRSPMWGHRLKRKAALNWKNLGQRDGDAEVRVAKPDFEDGKVIPSQVISYAFRRSKDRPIEASGLGILLAKPNAIEEDKKEKKVEHAPVSYILASHQMEVGSKIVNYDGYKGGGSKKQETLDLNFQVGNCMPLADIRLGTFVHDIEIHPGQGAKLTRAAGTYAKVVKEPVNQQCLVRLPSGREMLIDSRCKATIGVVSNPSHGARKLRKAGQNRWRGWRPVVRGVAMNPIDHPHGGGEGRTSGGRPSVSPWGKPTKSGFKTVSKSKRDRK